MATSLNSPPIRVLRSTNRYFPNSPLAIGRNHASWFVCFTRPYGIHSKRADMCLNYISDASSIESISSDGFPIFTMRGALAEENLSNLLGFRDEEGRVVVALLETRKLEYGEEEYVVEVRVPDAELMHACAHCGKWEVPGGPRFLRCSGCRARRYCSVECQKDDWKQQWHKGECSLLKEGKLFEAERRRRLHDNDWWMSSALSGNGAFGDARSAERRFLRAMDTFDRDFLAYGARTPPRDVRG
ncbi:hypothetical protein K466DRAFT_602978 [Polyporus arcularius HHB13444]|uniref:MYND-type domain-containing protein n=1 Tax=Polyporus arcularius HHB13444 TaxID=1314778 RepID=A0A5C3P3W3_9APHY|nr:hypothetical protein K466DRAFT_602978 [Polyporus arcularius HHB13444]